VPETIGEKLARLEVRWKYEAILDQEPEVPAIIDSNWLRETLLDPALAEANDLLSHRYDQGSWPQLDEDEDAAFPPLQAELDAAVDRRKAIEKHLLELHEDILRLQGSERTVDRGLIGLPEDADVNGAEIVLRGRDGTVLGTWRVAEGENIRLGLESVELEPIDVPQSEPAPDAG
jgi:hypothetical protein